MDRDLVADILERVIRCAEREGTFTADMAVEIELQVRREWGGERTLITKTSPRQRQQHSARIQAAAQEAATGTPVQDAAERHGVSRMTLYRMMRKP